MRYAAAQYGEYATAVGEFSTGRTVTIEVYDLADGSALNLDDDDCTEIGTTGVFYWSSSNITSTDQPADYTELLYIMTDVTPVVGTGRTHKGKIIIGGYPSDSAIRRFQQKVWIDMGIVNVDPAFPSGTPEKPVSSVAIARAIAVGLNLKAFRVKGSIAISSDSYDDWNFEGVDPATDTVTFSGTATCDRAQFTNMGIRGALSGDIAAEKCLIGIAGSTLTGLAGTFTECGFDGTIQPRPAMPGNHQIQGLNLASKSQEIVGSSCILDYNSVPCAVIGELKGIWRVENMTSTGPPVLAAALQGARLIINDTCTGGVYILLGYGELERINGAPVTSLYFEDDILRGTRLDITSSSILAAITALNNLSSSDVTNAVWAISEAALASAGPAGQMMAIGLSRNTQIDFTGDDLLGWQLVVNDTAGSEIARADLYDEAFARIPATVSVSDFISNQKSIAKVVPS